MEQLFDNLHLGTQALTKINDCNFVLPKTNDSAMYNSAILQSSEEQTDERMMDLVPFHPPMKRHSSSKKESKANMKKNRKKLVREHVAKKKSSLLTRLSMHSVGANQKRKLTAKFNRKQTKDAKMLIRIRKRQLKTQMKGIRKTLSMLKCS